MYLYHEADLLEEIAFELESMSFEYLHNCYQKNDDHDGNLLKCKKELLKLIKKIDIWEKEKESE